MDYGMEQAARHGREIGEMRAHLLEILGWLNEQAVIEVCLAPENESARACIEAARKEARHALEE